MAIPFRHGQAVVVAGCHQWTSTGHPSPYHIMTPPPTMVLWVQGSLGSGSGSFSPHHPSHSHTCPGQSTALGHQVLLFSLCCSPGCISCARTLSPGCGCSTGPRIWHGGQRQLIKVLFHGKETGRISDKQVASSSSSRASLLVSGDLESNPQQLQQALATLVRRWRNSPTPRPELKGKSSPVKAASNQPTPGRTAERSGTNRAHPGSRLLAQRTSSRQCGRHPLQHARGHGESGLCLLPAARRALQPARPSKGKVLRQGSRRWPHTYPAPADV